LLGRYYPNPNWDGQPALVRNDPFLDTYFHLTPLPRPYSAAWEGMLDAPESGVYVLGLRSVGAARLVLNDRQLLEAVVPNETAQARVTLAAGLHPIRVTFQDTLARSQIHLLWALPGAEQLAPVPAQNLWPPLGSAWRPPARSAPAVPPFETRAMRLVHAATLSEGLVEPRDVAVGPGETAFVADTGVKGVVVFQNFRRVGVWADTADGPFEEPLALVSAPGGSVWVLDSTRQWVYGLTLSGGALGRVGGPEALLYHPRGLALFAAPGAPPTLAIANTGSGQVALFGLDGAPLGTVGMFGEAPGQFNEPVDALRDAFGTYYVTEGANAGRWQRVDSSGRPLAAWPTDAPVALDGSHMAWGPDGSILMTNSQAGSVRRYSPEGELLDEWQAVGPVRFNRPVGIFAAQEQVWVADVGNGEVYVFRVEIE
ncbi:MAG: PA14 domain-containing protein, partial [Anaerolineae bacterium]